MEPDKGSEGRKPASAELRSAILDSALVHAVSRGGRVEYRSQFQAVVVYGKPVNHILHLILSIVTAGLWLIVWFLVAQSGGERRDVIDVDSFGKMESKRAYNLGPNANPFPNS